MGSPAYHGAGCSAPFSGAGWRRGTRVPGVPRWVGPRRPAPVRPPAGVRRWVERGRHGSCSRAPGPARGARPGRPAEERAGLRGCRGAPAGTAFRKYGDVWAADPSPLAAVHRACRLRFAPQASPGRKRVASRLRPSSTCCREHASSARLAGGAPRPPIRHHTCGTRCRLAIRRDASFRTAARSPAEGGEPRSRNALGAMFPLSCALPARH